MKRHYPGEHPELAPAARLMFGNERIRLIRLGTNPWKRLPACEVCGSTVNSEWHHDDYSRPLDVRPLCGSHHKLWHARPNTRMLRQSQVENNQLRQISPLESYEAV